MLAVLLLIFQTPPGLGLASPSGDAEVESLFKRAESHFAAGRFEQAATLYTRCVDRYPTHRAVDGALFNAAVAFERLQRAGSAERTYERLSAQYPQSRYADSALWRLGSIVHRRFDFERAVIYRARLTQEYPASEHHAAALHDVALMFRLLGHHARSARSAEAWARQYPESIEAAQVLVQAAAQYEAAGDRKRAAAVWRRVSTLSKIPLRFRLRALSKQATEASNRGRRRAAKRLRTQLVQRFRADGGRKGSAEAVYAAKAQFMLLDYEYRRFEAMNIGPASGRERDARRIRQAVGSLERGYAEIVRLGAHEWRVAALFRMARVGELMVAKLDGMGIRDDLELNRFAERMLEHSYLRYQDASRLAAKSHVGAPWAGRIRLGLNRYAPESHPKMRGLGVVADLQRPTHGPAALRSVSTARQR